MSPQPGSLRQSRPYQGQAGETHGKALAPPQHPDIQRDQQGNYHQEKQKFGPQPVHSASNKLFFFEPTADGQTTSARQAHRSAAAGRWPLRKRRSLLSFLV